jgi:hypothetical protein
MAGSAARAGLNLVLARIENIAEPRALPGENLARTEPERRLLNSYNWATVFSYFQLL